MKGTLLKLIKGGTIEGQEAATKAIEKLGKDPECVRHLIQGMCSVFAKILKDPNTVLSMQVSQALSELVPNDADSQEHFS